MPLSFHRSLGYIRYGFITPDGEPRLKTLHMYLLETPELIDNFDPPARESIKDVAWFTPREASQAVSHRSLRPLMRRVFRLLEPKD